jgi:hypothetical protein
MPSFGTCPIPNPLTYHTTTLGEYGLQLGGLYNYFHATYGDMVLRYVRFRDAVAYENGHVCVLAVATGLTEVTNDISGGSAIGTAGDAAVSQQAVGIIINTAGVANQPAQNEYGFVMKSGVHPIKSDDGISQDHRLVPDAVDGGADTMADGEEEQVFAVALADDNDTTDRVLASVFCR